MKKLAIILMTVVFVAACDTSSLSISSSSATTSQTPTTSSQSSSTVTSSSQNSQVLPAAEPLTISLTTKEIPNGWVYQTNNPQYPDPDFYTATGLKFNFVNIGL